MKNSRSGQALVEFALSLPLLALLLFAIIQWAFIFNTYMTLRHAAQVTSRTLSLSGASADAQTVACEAIQSTLDCANLQSVGVNTNLVVGGSTRAVEVTLTYDLPLIISFVVPNVTDNTMTLTAVAVDRNFN